MAEFTVGPYQSVRLLGEGGMARVFLARHVESNAEFALKVSRQSVPMAPETLRNEFETYKKLDSGEFPKVHELIEDGERLVMVMDVVGGDTLEHLLEQRSGQPLFNEPDNVIDLAIKITSALSHASERGLVHADLKPANIFIDNDAIRIIDFGLATGASSLTAEDIKEIKGTISYLSPEQAEGAPLDIRSDIFSTGVILYECLTGKRPFDSGYDMATIYSIMYEDPTPPSKLNTKLGSVVDRVVMGMLSKSPDDRYRDFASVTAALEALKGNMSAGESVSQSRVMILPFSAKAENETDSALAEGLIEELILSVGKIENINAMPLASVKKLSPDSVTPEEVRASHGADYLVTGSVRSAGGRVRVTATLLRTSDSETIWSDRIESPLTDLFDLQDTLAAEILHALTSKLAPSDNKSKSSTRSTSNVEAYEFYLKGRGYLTRNTQDDMQFAKTMLERAVELDPNYPLAYAGLADLHASMWMNYYDRTDERWNRGIEMAQKSVELEPSLPNGYRAWGRLLHLRGRFDEAIEKLERAASLDAGYGEVYRTLAWACEGKGDLNQSLAWTRKALSINPHSEETILLQGILNYDLNNMPQAVNAFQRCLEIQPDYGRAHYMLARTYQKMGRFDDAAKSYPLAERFGGQPEIVLDFGWFEYCRGRSNEAVRLLQKGADEGKLGFIIRYFLARVQRSLGNQERVESNLRLAVQESDALITAGDTSQYPVLVKALALASLNETELADEIFEKYESEIERSHNGELAVLSLRYSALRNKRSDVIKWLERALSWRLGISSHEALIDPDLKDYHDAISSISAGAIAA